MVDHQCIPQQARYWEASGFRTRLTKDKLERCSQEKHTDIGLDSPGKKQTLRPLTDKNGIGVCGSMHLQR